MSLKEIYDEDQRDRRERLFETDKMLFESRDAERLAVVLDDVEQNVLQTPADCVYAAMVLQHGNEQRHFELAHELAERAVREGFVPGEDEVDPLWLSAASKDRALMNAGKPQRYGTQSQRGEDGLWRIYPVDPNVTDEERAQFHVPTLGESVESVRKLNAHMSKFDSRC